MVQIEYDEAGDCSVLLTPEDIYADALALTCPTCEAPPGQWGQKKGDFVMLHRPRAEKTLGQSQPTKGTQK
jgi:hypothetical protein